MKIVRNASFFFFKFRVRFEMQPISIANFVCFTRGKNKKGLFAKTKQKKIREIITVYYFGWSMIFNLN